MLQVPSSYKIDDASEQALNNYVRFERAGINGLMASKNTDLDR